MSKHCNIIPQIANSTGYMDSILFKSILDKGISRIKAKNIYEAYHSKEFKTIFGDWTLYQSLKLGTANADELATFNSLYNGDIKQLEDTLDLSNLNYIYEPLLEIDENVIPKVNKGSISFKSIEDFRDIAKRLNVEAKQLEDYIIKRNNSIYYQLENEFINESITPVTGGNTLNSLYGLDTISEINSKANNFGILNSNMLTQEMNNEEILFLDNLISGVLIDDFEEFKKLIVEQSKSKRNKFLQIEKINRFITKRVNNFKTKLALELDELIKKETENNNQDMIIYYTVEKQRLIEAYDNVISEFNKIQDNGDRSFLYRSVLSHLNRNFNIRIDSTNNIIEIDDYDDNGVEVSHEVNLAEHLTKGAMQIDKSRNVAQELKLLISRCLISSTFKNVEGKLNLSQKYGIDNILTIDDIWGTLISVTVETKGNLPRLIKTLRTLDKIRFDNKLKTFIDTLEVDENIQNSFYSSINLSVIPNITLSYNASTNNNYIKVNKRQNNYKSFPENIAFESILSLIQINLENNKDYTKELTKEYEKTAQATIDKYRYNETFMYNQFRKLGITSKLSKRDFQIYVLNKLGIDISNIQNINDIQDFDRIVNTPEYSSSYLKILDETIKSLIYLGFNLKNTNVKFRENSKSAKSKFRFKQSFTETSSLRNISRITVLNQLGNVNLSYLNSNRDTEQSPQYHSYLTLLLDAITPIQGELNVNDVKEKLEYYINDELLANNIFLYNLSGFDFGLFNCEFENGSVKRNSKGLPVIKDINPNFITYFKRLQLEGVKNEATGTANKYDEIYGDSWNITALVQALSGSVVISSSDSPRSFGIELGKYGLNNFMFDEEGKYISLLDIQDKVGIYKKDSEGNKVRRTKEDITDDSLFYFEIKNKKLKEYTPVLKTYAEIKESAKDDTIIKENLLNVTKYFIYALQKSLKSDYSSLKDLNLKTLDTVFVEGDVLNIDDITIYTKFIHEVINYLNVDKISKFDEIFFLSNSLVHDVDNLNPYHKKINVEVFKDHLHDLDTKGKNFRLYRIALEEALSLRKESKEYLNIDKLLEKDQTLLDSISKFRNSPTTKAFVNTVYDEMTVAQKVFNKLFTVNYGHRNVKDNTKRYVKSFEATEYAKEGSIKGMSKLHDVLDYNGDTLLDDNKYPTGKAFKFTRLTYIENGKVVILNDYASNYSYTKLEFLDLVLRSNIKTHPLRDTLSANVLEEDYKKAKITLDDILYSFVDKVLSYRQNQLITKTEPYKDEVIAMRINTPAYVAGTHGDTNYNRSEKQESRLISTDLKIKEETVEESEVNETQEDEDSSEKSKLIDGLNKETIDRLYNRAMLEAFINDYIYTSYFCEDLLYGRPYEYKDALDANKRVSQIFKNGKSNNIKEEFSSMTIGDVKILSNMLDDLSNSTGLSKEIIHKRYLGEVEVGNGLSMITVDEFIKRLKTVNMYEGKLKVYIEALTNDKVPFDYKKYDYVAEQLKYFLYARQPQQNGTIQGSLISYQEKNSTIVLFPKLYAKTDFGIIAEWMKSTNLGELNFKSGSKVGGAPTFNIHDTFKKDIKNEYTGEVKNYNIGYTLKKLEHNGKMIFDDRIDRNKPYSEDNRINIKDYVVNYKYSDLRIQQETVSHILDEDGVLSTQMIKQILVNLMADEIYTISGVDYRGRTNGKVEGVFELFQHALSFNAEHSRDSLIAKWGGLSDGKIKYKQDGTIDVDVNLIRKSIQEAAFNDGNINLMRAFEPNQDNKNEPLLDFNFPTISNSVEQLCQSKITKGITRQTLPQIHGTIVPDLFLSPANNIEYSKKDIISDEVIKDYYNNGWISLTTAFKEQIQANGSFELKSEHDSNGVIQRAQIVLNLWDSKLNAYRETKNVNGVTESYIDIDSIPPETLRMIATRIPHEGMQSALVIEVVGIMNTSASQIIVPSQLALQTGWDFDIDTLYIYTRHLYERTNDKGESHFYPISREFDKLNPTKAYDTKYNKLLNYFKVYYAEQYSKIYNTKEIKVIKAREEYKKAHGTLVLNYRTETHKKFVSIVRAIKNRDTSNLGKEEFDTLVRKVLEIGEGMATPNLVAIENYITNINNKADFASTYNAYSEVLDSAINDILLSNNISIKNTRLLLKDSEESFINKYFTYNSDIKLETERLQDKLESDLILIENEFKSSLEEALNNQDLIETFDKLNPLKQASREVRDNLIIDIIEARLLHPNSNIHRTKNNDFQNSYAVSKYINKLYNTDSKMLNFSNLSDRMDIRNMNINTRKLKGIAVSLQNLMAMYGTIGGNVGKNLAIPIMVDFDEMITNDRVEQVKILDKYIGKGNYFITDNGYLVMSTYFGNNKTGDWKNIVKEAITEQSTEVVSNILDAVKFNFGKNIDPNTVHFLTMFANSPVSHVVSVDGSAKKANSFMYSNLLLHQPIVSKFIAKLNYNTRNGEYADKNNATRGINNDIHSKIITLLNKIDISTGTIKQLEESDTLLDVFKQHIRNSEQFGDVKTEALNQIQNWINNAKQGKELVLYANSKLDIHQLYNSFIKMLNKDTLEESISDYLLNKYGNTVGKEMFSRVSKSNLISTIENISKFKINKDALFTYNTTTRNYEITDKRNVSKFDKIEVENDYKSFKNIKQLDALIKRGVEKSYDNIDGAFSNLVKSNDVSSILDYVDFLNQQLDVFRLFEHINNVHNSISISQRVLKTEKLGTSPNSTVTAKLFDDLADMYFDVKSFEKQMSLSKKFTVADIDRFKSDYNKAQLIKSNNPKEVTKLKVMQDIVDRSKVNDKPTVKIIYTGLYAGDTQMAEAIFPNYINNTMNKDFDFTKSIYPYLEAQLMYSNKFSTESFSNILLFEKPNFKVLLNSILSDLNIGNISQSKKEDIVSRIQSIIKNDYIMDKTPFFSGGFEGALRELEVLRVIGEVETFEEEVTVGDTTKIVKTVKTVSVLSNEQDSDSYIRSNGIPSLNDFAELSTANQVYLLQNNLRDLNDNAVRLNVNRVSDYNDVLFLLNTIEVSLKREQLIDNGYHRLSIADTGKNQVQMQQIFTKLYFNENAYVRQTARDLIRYAFHTSGLLFGNNISKFIDLSLYYQDYAEYDKIGEHFNNRLSRTASALSKLKNDSDIEFTDDYKDYIMDTVRRQLFDDNYINPKVVKVNKANEPTWDKYIEFPAGTVIKGIASESVPVIRELASKIKDSKYNKNKSIKTTLASKYSIKGLVGFKKVEIENDPYIYYYPFSKSLPFELSKAEDGTVVKKYKEKIYSKEYYLEVIKLYSNSNKESTDDSYNSNLLFETSENISLDFKFKQNSLDNYNYNNVITESKESYTNTAKKIIDNSDVILYIGNNTLYKKAFNSDKTLYTTIENFDINILNNIDFTESKSITIVGDTIMDNTLTQQDYDKVLIPYISMLSNVANIKTINTIYKKGVGESVFKSTYNKNISKEYIKVGTKDNVDELEYNSAMLTSEFDINSMELAFTELVGKEVNLFNTLERLHNYSTNVSDIPSAPLYINVHEIRDIIKGMNETENRFASMQKAIDINSEKARNIIEIITYDTIDLQNGITHTVLDIPVFNYMATDNVEAKSIIARKLLNYSNLIQVAKSLINIQPINRVELSEEDYAALSEEDKINYNRLNAEIDKLHNSIILLKQSVVTDSNGNEMNFQKGYDTMEAVIEQLDKKINLRIAEYFVSISYQYSRNKKFKNSKFNKLLEKIKNDTGEEISISANELSELYKELLVYNDDLTSAAFYLDSMRDTGIAIVDNSFTILTELKLEANRIQEERLNEIENILAKYPFLSNKNTKYSKQRSDYFSKLINPETGKFLDEYNWDSFYKDLDRSNINSERIKALSKALSKDKMEVTILYDFITDVDGKHSLEKNNKVVLTKDYLKDRYRVMSRILENLDSKPKEVQDFVNEFLASTKVQSTSNGRNAYKLFTFKLGDKEVDYIIELDLNNKPIYKARLVEIAYLKIDGTSYNVKELEDYKGNELIGQDEIKENQLGQYETIESSADNPEFVYHLSQYDARGLAFNASERRRYERKHHIYFYDAYARDKRYTLKDAKFRKEEKKKQLDDPTYMMSQVERDLQDQHIFRISKLVPKESYRNEKYQKLKQEDKYLIKDVSNYMDKIVSEVFPTKYLDDTFIPYIFITHQLSLGQSLGKFFNWKNIKEEYSGLDIFGNPTYYFKSHSLSIPDIRNLIRFPEKSPTESIYDYEAKAVKEANTKLESLKRKNTDFKDTKEFYTLEDVHDFNNQVLLEYSKNNGSKLNYDLISVLDSLTRELSDIKINSDFSNTFRLLLNTIANDVETRQEKADGKHLFDKAAKKITGETTFAHKKGTQTKLYERMKEGEKVIFGVSKINSTFDQIAASTLRYTSMNVMWFNYHTGVKNVMKGVSDMFIEYYGGEWANRKEFGKGLNEYRSNLPSIITAFLNGKITSKTSAILHKYAYIYNDHTEGSAGETGGVGAKAVKWAEMGGYIFMSGGEHFLQFTTLLTLLKSHRLVGGMALSLNEYIANNNLDIAKKHLSEEEFTKLTEHSDRWNKNKESKYRYKDAVSEWLSYNANKLDASKLKSILDNIKENEKVYTEKFKALPTLESQYVFEDGKLTTTDEVTLAIEAKFVDRVKALNDSMHGIYNTLDRNVIQNTISGEIIFQFRKWMRPVWIRYMGDRFSLFSNKDKSTFNERLGTYRSGAFSDFGRFMRLPYTVSKYNSKESPELNAMVEMFKTYLHFAKNIKFYYAMLTPTQKANVDRTIMFMTILTALTALTFAAGIGYGDDDEEEGKLRDWALYNLSGLQTEYMEVLPYYGWYAFYKRTKQSPFPAEKQLDGLIGLLENSIMYPIREDKENVYQRGQYQGKSKLEVSAFKAVPIARQIQKEMYLSASINYYGMFNPFVTLGR